MEIMREDRVVMRLGDLINNVLERSWDKSKQTDAHHILEHAISWASFPTFIEMYCKYIYHMWKRVENHTTHFWSFYFHYEQ